MWIKTVRGWKPLTPKNVTPPVYVKTLTEQLGLTMDDTTDQFCNAITEYLERPGERAYRRMQAIKSCKRLLTPAELAAM